MRSTTSPPTGPLKNTCTLGYSAAPPSKSASSRDTLAGEGVMK
jgi:hypothetical protein